MNKIVNKFCNNNNRNNYNKRMIKLIVNQSDKTIKINLNQRNSKFSKENKKF